MRAAGITEEADAAELGRLSETIGRLLPELDRFLEADGPDLAVTDRGADVPH